MRGPSQAGDGDHVFALGAGATRGGGPDAGALASGTALCPNLDLHHDGDAAALCRLSAPGAGLTITCGAFGGSYLSLAAAVPREIAGRFGPGRVLRLEIEAETSRPLATFLRLNLGSADGHEVLYETIVVHRGRRRPLFDLDAVRLPFDGRLHAWADIIFSRPDGAEITLSALRLALVGKDEL